MPLCKQECEKEMEAKSIKHKRGLRAGRVVVNLNRDEFEFIDRIGRDALFTTGKRLTNNKILQVFVDVMKDLAIDGSGVSTCKELRERLRVALGMKVDCRTYPRFQKEVKIFLRKLDSMSEYAVGKTMDIGQCGFRIELKEERKEGELLELTILDPSRPYRPIVAFGRIAWLKRRNTDNVQEAGIELTYLLKKETDRFKALLHEISSSKGTGEPERKIVEVK